MTPLDSFLLRLPKAELHVHLEGSMPPATLWALAQRHRIDLPVSGPEGLDEWFRFRDFEHFVEVYLTLSRCLKEPEDFRLLMADFLTEQARQNILYTEVHFTLATHIGNGADGRAVLDALHEAMEDGRRRHGIGIRLILDIVRNAPLSHADSTLEWSLAGRDRGVVAMGVSGIEKGLPNEPYREHFRAAEAAGLRCVAHAGEHAGPESIRSVLEVCRAERVGHGVRAVEDPALVAELAASGIPLEVCPTSNVRLGVFPSLAEHSFDALHRAGAAVTVNSDDPPLFGTTLTDEYRALAVTFGYTPVELVEFARRAFEHAFLSPEERGHFERRFERETAALAQELGIDLNPSAAAGP
ncbi:MAG: adenosine deaminase [Acidobacteriota bacterium]